MYIESRALSFRKIAKYSELIFRHALPHRLVHELHPEAEPAASPQAVHHVPPSQVGQATFIRARNILRNLLIKKNYGCLNQKDQILFASTRLILLEHFII